MLLALSILAVSVRLGVAETNSFTKNYEFPETQVKLTWSFGDNQYLSYLRCNTSYVPGESAKCIVGMKFDAFENATELTRECEVSLKPDESYQIINMSLQVHDFGKDKILILWWQISKETFLFYLNSFRLMTLKTTVVHMFDSCRTFETKVKEYEGEHESDHSGLTSVATFEDTYELILKSRCERYDYECYSLPTSHDVYKFDSHCRNTSEHKRWPNQPPGIAHNYFVTSYDFGQQKEGYVMQSWNGTKYAVEVMDKRSLNYERRDIVKISSGNYPLPEDYCLTLTNEAIGFGHVFGKKMSKVICWQTDLEGNIQIKRQFALKYPYKAELEAMYNTRKGGLLLAVKKSMRRHQWHAGNAFCLMKVNDNGQFHSVDVHFDSQCIKPKWDDGFAEFRIFENEKGQYCVVRLCQILLPKPIRWEIAVHCYSNEEFSKCNDCVYM